MTLVQQLFTEGQDNPYKSVQWERRDACIGDPAKPVFQQKDVEFPADWSQNAANIVAQKYFRGQPGSSERECSVWQMITRVVSQITTWGTQGKYFASSAEAEVFKNELAYILLHQMAAFNSPVWFNVGFEENPQCSACFILSVQDDMDSILAWNTQEGIIFRGGSGSGINLSNIRGSMELLSKGGAASGPVSFMRGADSWAATIKSGGITRRAAKMVVLDIDHPDIREFIWCKAREEDKAQVLRDAGFDMSMDGDGLLTIQYQNANNSVRVTDEFMQAVEQDEDWALNARTTGKPVQWVKARELMREIAEAAWRCADPGMQYDTTINNWHTCSKSGRINASNPCSEYMHIDDSACNLASINLMKFRSMDGTFNTREFEHVVDVMILAQEILVSPSSYPTEQIGKNARAFRQLGLGYANLGALLMSNGMSYDSEDGRATAAAITALMTGRAYRQSACVAAVLGPYERYAENREGHNGAMYMHQTAAYNLDEDWDAVPPARRQLLNAGRQAWDEAIQLAAEHGYRNAQATVLAPTGTIAFMMDCDTTGIEPDFALIKSKELVGGGQMQIVNGTVELALKTLGYTEEQTAPIMAHLLMTGTIIGAPGLKNEHLRVFDVAVGQRAISHMGHIMMMGAVQPFISGAISKTVNLPQSATVDDVADAYMEAWRHGVKALAIYRDGSKTAQALRTSEQSEPDAAVTVEGTQTLETGPRRRRMPRERNSVTHKFSISGHKGYITAGMYEDGSVGEIFLTDVGKEGSTLKGMMNSFATAISIALQYGVPLETLVRKFSYMRFEPEGVTGNVQIPFAKSMPDYIMRWLATRFLDTETQAELGIATAEVRQQLQLVVPEVSNGAVMQTSTAMAVPTEYGLICSQCGGMMVRTGTCHACTSCGSNTGCG